MVVDFDFDDDEARSRTPIQDLLFDMTGKTDDELWAIVADACRGNSKDWRAYEKLHGRFTHLKNQEKAYSELYAKHYGSEEQHSEEQHRVTFEADLLSSAISKAEKWRKEHPRAFILSATEMFNPSGKSSITYCYKNHE